MARKCGISKELSFELNTEKVKHPSTTSNIDVFNNIYVYKQREKREWILVQGRAVSYRDAESCDRLNTGRRGSNQLTGSVDLEVSARKK